MITAAALAFAVNIAGAAFNWIFQKAGRLTTQIVLFVLALGAAIYYTYSQDIPGLTAIVATAIGIFSVAVAFYEVLLRYLPAFSGPQ